MVWGCSNYMAEQTDPQPRSFCKFCWDCIQEAWRESREKFGLVIDISFLLTTIGLCVMAWYSKHHASFNESEGEAGMSYWFAVIPSLLWAAWFLYHIPKAAHKIYKEQFDKHAAEIAEKTGQIQNMTEEIKSLRDPTKRQFLAFLAQLEGEIKNVIPQHWSQFYRNKIPNIKHAAALMAEDFSPKDQESFEMLVNTMCDESLCHSLEMRTYVLAYLEHIRTFTKNPPNFP
jgi:hypothetical protein